MPRFLFLVLLSAACGDDPSDATPPTDAPGTADTAEPTVPTPGSEAALASLDLGVALIPPFEPGRSFYALRASALGDEVVVDAEASEGDAEITVWMETVDGEWLETGEALSVDSDRRIRIDVVSGNGAATRTYAIGLLPDNLPRPYVEGAATEGWTFLSARSSDDLYGRFLLIVDDLGTPAWWRRAKGGDFRVTGDGRISWHGPVDGFEGPRNVVLSPDRDAFDVNLGPGPIPDGWESVEVDEHEWDVVDADSAIGIILGKVKEDLTAYGSGPEQLVEHQKAQHMDHEGNILFEWSTQGLLPYELLPPNLYSNIGKPDWEPFHINSVAVDPEDGHWVLSLQRVSMVVKVARHGPQEGQVLWKLSGGAGSDLTIVDDVRPSGWVGFAGQHDVRVTGPNRVSMYDAGLGDSGGRGDARYVEYELDLDTMEARVIDEHVWTGWGNGGAGGTAQRLPNGGVLVGFGSLTEGDDGTNVPLAMELSPEGEEVWSLWCPGVTWSYRAWRQHGDPLAWSWSRTPG